MDQDEMTSARYSEGRKLAAKMFSSDNPRLDRLCVIAAGVVQYLAHTPDEITNNEPLGEFAGRVAVVSRAILAKLEEE